MQKLTLIIDLDNTIYPVKAIGDKLFKSLFELLEKPEFKLSASTIEKAKKQIMRVPFQKVADEFKFPPNLTDQALELLRNLTYDDKIDPFDDYKYLRELDALKFLLTTGFIKLQESKIERLGIRKDFEEIFIIDPDKSKLTKKDMMQKIIRDYDLEKSGVVIVGDDAESEIKAARDLNLTSFLLDPENQYPDGIATYKRTRLKDLLPYLKKSSP